MRIQFFRPVGRFTSSLLLFPALLLFSVSNAIAGDLSAQAQVVAQTERAFSSRCAEIGMRDSFLEYFAADAIHFDPGPRLARPDLERESSVATFRLTWEPKIIRVASSGQLAVSTGAYILQNKTGQQSFGYFLSIWKRLSGGEWKVGVDIGVPGTPRLRPSGRFSGLR
jgi:ketosteroid isomerase-like protein